MAINIAKVDAEKVLLSAFRMRCTKADEIADKIAIILKGTHKTYKYILVNGLLAKAIKQTINALALQAGAPIEGAYDARSLCHDVLVPFERDFLENSLGGSNEPFLNKPARFTHLSKTNAVRRGNDKITLGLLIEVFEFIRTSEDAHKYLACALDVLNTQIKVNQTLHESEIKYNPTLVEVYEFILRFLDKSLEGETSAIVVGTLEKLLHKRFKNIFNVIAHKVNQSGASSKEIGDIDVYKEEKFIYAIEVKDKNFTPYDLEHAFKKMQAAGASKGQFIYGPNASFENEKIKNKIKEFEQNNFLVLFDHVVSYARTMLVKIDLYSKQEFLDTIMETAIEINSKNETKEWFHLLLKDLGWK